MIKADLYAIVNRPEDREAEWGNNQLLLAKLPGVAWLHANLAIVSAFLAATTEPQRATELKALAASEASVALKLNPHEDRAYLARSILPLIGHWRDREMALLSGLKAVPQSGILTNHESNLLREVGRLNDALIWARRAEAPKPPTPNRETTLLLALAAANQTAEGSSVAERIATAWPLHTAAWNGRLQALIFVARWDDALALFQPKTVGPIQLSEPERRAWIMALGAMKSGNAAAKQAAVRAFAALPPARLTLVQPPYEVYSPAARIGMIAVLGDKDEALAEAEAYLQKDTYADSAFLFWPNIEDFRRDKRFLQLVTRIGLIDYWRTARAWPDFCSDRQLPYDCQSGLQR